MHSLLSPSPLDASLGVPGVLRPLVDRPSHGYACVDLETTGTDPARDAIVSVALVLLGPDGAEEARWSRVVDPGRPIPLGASRVHGLTDDAVRGMPRFAELAGEVEELIAGRVLVAFNARFDHRLLEAELGRAGRDFRPAGEGCVLQAVQAAYPLAPGHRLPQAAAVLGLEPPTDEHDALADVLVAAAIARSMLAEGLDPAGSELDVPLFFWLRSRLGEHAASDAQIRRLYAVARHAERLCDPSGYVDDGLLLGEAARVAGVSTLASLTARQVQDLYDAIEPDGAERRRQGHALLAALERRPGGGRERDGAARWPARP